jgi:hypothetical protein
MNEIAIKIYDRLEKEYIVVESLKRTYYSNRYSFFKSIAAAKGVSPLDITYKSYEGIMRRDCKKRQRAGEYGERKRGYEFDHYFVPVLLGYILGLPADILNNPLNIKSIPKKENTKKGLLRATPLHPLWVQSEYIELQRLIAAL